MIIKENVGHQVELKVLQKKMIKCEDLARPDVKQEIYHVGNFKPTNVRKLTQEEIKEREL